MGIFSNGFSEDVIGWTKEMLWDRVQYLEGERERTVFTADSAVLLHYYRKEMKNHEEK